jgi:hypothetical protein
MSGASVIGVFDVADLPSDHPEVFPDKGGKAIPATKTKGFLGVGPYVTGYRQPPKFLDVYFSIYIDDNKGDNAKIVTLDVYDGSRNKTLAKQFFRRRQFKAGLFNLFKLRFRVLDDMKLEFRIFYEGGNAYVAADKIAVVNPEKIQLNNHDDILKLQVDSGGDTGDDTGGNTDDERKEVLEPNILLKDSLKDGQTKGIPNEHTEWTQGGLKLREGYGFIRYKIPSTPRGFVEFNARGFIPEELHGGSEYKGILLSMWDEEEGYDYDGQFIFELRKYGYIEGRRDATDSVWMKILSNGEWGEAPKKHFSWDSNKIYRFRLEWGGGEAKIYRDNELLNTGHYRPEFAPPQHLVQIGANPLRGRRCPHNIVISDVVVGKL